MRALRIFVNNIEIDHVREDVKIKEENNSFTKNIIAPHTTRPIRIVENINVIKAMGEFDLNASIKKKFFKCLVVRGAVRYNGVITQNEKISGFRKCDLKYGSEVNEVMEKEISSFMPDFNVKGWDFFPAYTEESSSLHNAGNDWINLEQSMQGKIYPEVKWQLPQLSYKNKFGTDLKENDSHYQYRGLINKRYFGFMPSNVFTQTTDIIEVSNQNVIAPQVFVLSPLFYAFQSLGYSLTGNVIKSPFFKRLLLLSFNDNMTKIVLSIKGVDVDFDTPLWDRQIIDGVLSYPYLTYIKIHDIPITTAGEYRIKFNFEMDFPEALNHPFGIQGYWNDAQIGSFSNARAGKYDGELNFTCDPGQENQQITVVFHSYKKIMPLSYDVEVIKNLQDKDFYDTHPTIDFSRYIPDWSTADYLKYFMQLFNWKLDIDDVEKSISLNFNEQDYLIDGPVQVIKKSLQIRGLSNINAESYVLKYENDEDDFQFISAGAFIDNKKGDENTEDLETKFKYIPHRGATSELSKAIEDKKGQGLIIFDPAYGPNTSPNYLGQHLNITGDGGIFLSFHKKWFVFRLGALRAFLSGPFSQTELYQISKSKKIHIDNQLFLIKSLEYTENVSALFDTVLEVEAVTF